MQKNQIYKYLMAFGHFCSDINQGALAALLPFLIAAHNYDYATAASLVFALNITGSVVQPFIGHLIDKKNMPLIVTVGLAMAGGGMAMTGFTSDFAVLFAAVTISGIGIAMFHPQAAKIVNQASNSKNRAKGIGVFSFGGNLGFTFGPLLVGAFVGRFGLEGMAIFLLPQIIICAMLSFWHKGLVALGENEAKSVKNEEKRGNDDWGAFARLCLVVFGRSIAFHGLNTFLALYWINKLGSSQTLGSAALSFFYAVSAPGTLLGGYLADRYGYQNVIKMSFLVLLPCVALLAASENIYVASVLLVPMAASLSMSYSPMVVLGQQYLPNRVGLASGVTLGLSVSIGGIVAPILGKIADIWGITYTIYSIAAICALPLAVSFFLPKAKSI